ncbi:MAG: hypothetical protein RL235_297 [Chlamydiota bacterium]|jgi:LIVCS family branched-chain amino acid:cation transporter
MKHSLLVLSTGLAMFSMFFGSGNLVFPLVVGQLSDGHWALSFLGILLTGVLVPFLGILGVYLYNGNTQEFIGRLGTPATFWFPLFALSLMGPFGVLARCITVAHGAYRLIAPETPLWLFSIVGCGVIFILTIQKRRIVQLLGSILTPVLLVSLAAIAYFGLAHANVAKIAVSGKAWTSFTQGVFRGYQTMDLLAAFFFSSFLMKQLNDHKVFFQASLIGATLLGAVYLVLVLLGAAFAPRLAGIPDQEILGTIAQMALGSMAAPVVCVAIILACLTTAIVLASLFADFLKKEIAHERIPMAASLGSTLMIAWAISTLEFAGIAKILGPILDVTYPALIVLTLLNIGYKIFGWRTVRLPIAAAVLAKIITHL